MPRFHGEVAHLLAGNPEHRVWLTSEASRPDVSPCFTSCQAAEGLQSEGQGRHVCRAKAAAAGHWQPQVRHLTSGRSGEVWRSLAKCVIREASLQANTQLAFTLKVPSQKLDISAALPSTSNGWPWASAQTSGNEGPASGASGARGASGAQSALARNQLPRSCHEKEDLRTPFHKVRSASRFHVLHFKPGLHIVPLALS